MARSTPAPDETPDEPQDAAPAPDADVRVMVPKGGATVTSYAAGDGGKVYELDGGWASVPAHVAAAISNLDGPGPVEEK